MHCTHINLPHGIAIVCSSERFKEQKCETHGAPARFQCDWKTGDGKTCDRHLCGQCAKEVGPNKHLCPFHQAAYVKWRETRAAK